MGDIVLRIDCRLSDSNAKVVMAVLAPLLLGIAFLPGTSSLSHAAEAASASTVSEAHGAASQHPLDVPAVVAEVRNLIAARYVLADRRAALDAVLAEGLASGRYAVTDPAELAQRIGSDLREVGRDKHLGLIFDPVDAARRTAELAQSSASNDVSPTESDQAWRDGAANHGVTELRVLPGNVRYMAYEDFIWTGEESAAALDLAMRFLAGGNAIIIDLRKNTGGEAQPSTYLISHFMPAGQALYTFYGEGGVKAEQVVTIDDLPAGRLIGKPLYLLTSEETMSAAEAVVGNIAGFGLGEIVGENTAGGGNINAIVPIADRFVMSLSIGTVTLASTGASWDGVGIAPTIPASSGNALDAAHAHALARIIPFAPAEERELLNAMAEGMAARVEARSPGLPLSAYVGDFGERRVWMREGKLLYQFGDRPPRTLIAIEKDVFTFDDDVMFRIRFDQSEGVVSAFELGRVGQQPQGRYQRAT